MHYILLLLIALIWGSQYIFNTLALEELTPFGLMVGRLFFGFITLSTLIFIIPKERHGHFILTPKLLGLFLLIGAVEAAIPFFLIGYGQQRVPSSITAIIMGFIPLMTLFLEYLFKQRNNITLREIAGLFLALLGLYVLMMPDTTALTLDFLGVGAILLAALCFGLALILMAKIPQEITALRATRFILGLYALPLTLLWLYFNISALPTQTTTWSSIIILGLFSSGLVYLLYLTLIRQTSPSFTALSNYLVPLVGTFLGVTLFHEPLTSTILMALLLITVALMLIKKP